MNVAPLRFDSDGTVVELEASSLRALAAADSTVSPWRIEAPPDWERYESLRLLAATFGDGSVAALVALRPAGAAGHDAELIRAILVDSGKSAESAAEALLSTELDSERHVRRVGVELWTSDEPPPRRFAADSKRRETSDSGGVHREAVLMDARLDGESGVALFETLTAAG